MSKRKIWKRISSLMLVLAVLFAMIGTDTAPLVQTASAVTQGDIDALKDDADALADEKSAIEIPSFQSCAMRRQSFWSRGMLLDSKLP